MKFVFNAKTLDIKTGTAPQTVETDPEKVTFLVPGRYTIIDSFLYCEPAIVAGDLTFSTFGPGKFICQFPMNSSVILDTTTVRYGSVFK